jgi:feruloyl esterase
MKKTCLKKTCLMLLCAWPMVCGLPMSAQTCESLTSLKLPHTTISSATTAAAANNIPAHCAVKAATHPTSDSNIQFELWLPAQGWNGKYQQLGNGGWAGNIPVAAMAEPLRRGFATAGTDDGHTGGTAEWAMGHPEKLIDFGWRAVHETRLQAVAIIQAFYGRDTTRNYFVGCSDGGREALMEAQRFADDFDGIIAGAPAYNWSHLITGHLWAERALLDDPAGTIPVTKLPAIQKAALDKCDMLDGVKDGLIEDPRACHFDPAVIQCKGADGPECLTAPQVNTLRRIYSGPKNPRTGQQIFPGYAPGAEGLPDTWTAWIVPGSQRAPAQFGFANTYYGQAVFEDPNWDFRKFDFDADIAYGDQKAGPAPNSTSPDLRSFRTRGGKLIQYHGWGDAAVSPQGSIDYYELVRSFMGKYIDARSDHSKPVEDFYRLYMVPGMGHCRGGNGANNFGNGTTVAANDPERDLVAALDRWVEKDVAPDHFIGTGKSLTRLLCAYPRIAHYKGSGDTNDAANFSCSK